MSQEEQNSFEYPRADLYRRVVHAKIYIDRHFSRALDLNHIANESHFSKFYFVKLFKSLYGLPPHHYLAQTRIQKAKQMLQENISVSQACVAVGYGSATSFSNLFRKQTGLSPSEYQKQFRDRQSRLKGAPLEFVPNCFAEHFFKKR